MENQHYNMQMATRQIRMNDYAYQNKMDTLFFFQILLLSLLILCIFAYGSRMGFFSTALVIYIGIILIFINTILFLGRYAYTVNLRDPNLWSRRRFAYETSNPTPAKTKDASGVNWMKFGLPDISGIDVSGLCMAAGY